MANTNEAVVLGRLPGSENEVETPESFISTLLPDSPHSTDSGMADSPDNSMPGSPYFQTNEYFPGNDSHPFIFEHDNVYPPPNQNIVASIENSQIDPLVLHGNNNNTPPPATIADAQSIQNLLQLLVSSKSTSEPVVKLLSTLISNSLKKDSAVKPQLPCARKILPDLLGRKRQRDPSSSEIPAKEPRLDLGVTRQTNILPTMVVTEQPEQNYRARYESEGCRGPVHGSSDLTFPTIKVEGYSDPLWVTVYLATSKGTPHFHLLCGPGSTKLPCRNIMLPGEIPAIQVLVGPETGMTAVLDCISLKRKRNFEADKELKRRGLNPVDWKSERKEACFVFSAEIPNCSSKIITCKSRVFQCTAPPGNPEIWWMKPEKGSVLGGEEIGLIGKKFPKGFKVRFFGSLPSGMFYSLCIC